MKFMDCKCLYGLGLFLASSDIDGEGGVLCVDIHDAQKAGGVGLGVTLVSTRNNP